MKETCKTCCRWNEYDHPSDDGHGGTEWIGAGIGSCDEDDEDRTEDDSCSDWAEE